MRSHLSDTPLQFAQNLFRSYLLSPELYETYQEVSPERMTASLHRKRLAHDSCGKSETSLARRFRLGGKKEGAGAAVAVMLSGIMDIEYDPDFR